MQKEQLIRFSPLVGVILCFGLTYLFTILSIWQLVFLAGFLGSFVAAKTRWVPWISVFGVMGSWGLYMLIQSLTYHSNILLDLIGQIILGMPNMGVVLMVVVLVIGGLLGLLSGLMGKYVAKLIFK
jgi:hypothetical protein